MTESRLPEQGKYKPMVYKRINHPKRYTSAKFGHDDYLETDVWRELREQRLSIDSYRCCICGTGINVNVHHVHYPEIWGEESVIDDLRTLCDGCHAKVHEKDRREGQ